MDEAQVQDHVILLHGLGRSIRIMQKMAHYLGAHGYFVHNIGYPSTQKPIETLAEEVYRKVCLIKPAVPYVLHFVGHSLGAIIIRRILQQHKITRLGRVVMLGAPNKGSAVANFFQRFAFYRKLYGPAGCQIASSSHGLLASLPPPDYVCGIISGNKSRDKLFSWFLLSGENDGKVTVESSKLEGMTDHLVIPAAHPCLPETPEVMRQTAFFLAQGYFEKTTGD